MKHFFYLLIFFPLIISAQDIKFVRTYGMKGYNYGEKAIQTKDNGYLLLGNKSGFIGNTDVYIAKINSIGKLIWDKALGDTQINWAEDFIQTTDKSYIITGYTTTEENNDYDILVMKIDSLGNLLWKKSYGGEKWDHGHSIIETPDNDFVITGETYSEGNGNNDIFLLKINQQGDSLWNKTFGGNLTDVGYDVSLCNDSSYIITGYTNSFGNGAFDMYILKVNQLGDTIWTKTIGGPLDDKAFSGIENKNHEIVLTGSTLNYNAKKQDGIIVKTDSIGNYKWERLIGGDNNEEFYEIIENINGGYFITGYTESYGYAGTKDCYSILTNSDGWFIGGPTYGRENFDISKSCIQTSDKGYLTIGSTESLGLGLSNILVVKRDSNTFTNENNYSHFTDIETYNEKSIALYPNPVADFLYIKTDQNNPMKEVIIYNSVGSMVYRKSTDSNLSHTISFKDFQKGMYIISIAFEKQTIFKKIIHN